MLPLLLLLSLPVFSWQRPPGCGTSPNWPLNKFFTNNVTKTGRSFQEFIPQMYDPNTQQPVLIYMHGQFGDAATLAAEKDFQAAR